MPKHYAVDINVISGTISLTNTKTAVVNFVNQEGQQISFTKEPRVVFTVLTQGVQNPYKVSSIKTGNLYTGFKIGFGQSVTANIEWQVMERA